QAIINFIIISFSIFMVVKVLNNFKKKEEAPAPAPKGPTTEELLSEIRDLLKESK
ncbi:MAG: MscL family protein, partial [Erysipelotrichales bacterium]|nr:MscL family protein [Erysipelotrichales bacterium]